MKSFPINCFDLLQHYGYECLEYSELEKHKQEMCFKVSEDAFKLKDKIFYNDNVLFCRRRFSLMHELGHIILNHQAPYTARNEQEANFFAGNILAPRIAIHYARCKNANDVSKLFRMTYEASSYAFDDYRRWCRKAVYRMSQYDKAMYQHFYDEHLKAFVWNKHTCHYCHQIIYNSSDKYCKNCFTPKKGNDDIPFIYNFPKRDENFLLAESNWLYGNDL